MSLRGYRKKWGPANWVQAFPGQAAKTPEPKPKRIRPVSKRRQQVTSEYRKAARQFVEAAMRLGLTCQVVNSIAALNNSFRYGHPISNRLNEVHHIRGRAGQLLTDQRFWMAVSKQGHRWIHEHPRQAQERGWLAGPGEWGKQADDWNVPH